MQVDLSLIEIIFSLALYNLPIQTALNSVFFNLYGLTCNVNNKNKTLEVKKRKIVYEKKV